MGKSPFKTSANTISSISTVIGITLVLVLVGTLLIVALLGSSVTGHYRGQVVVQVMMADDIAEEEIQHLKKQIEGEPFAAQVSYLSKQEAAAMMEEELGEEFVDFLGYNPLPASLDIHIKPEFSKEENIASVVAGLEKNPAVNEVVFQHDLLRQMNANLSKWSLGISLVGIVLLIIAIVLIVNTIQLAIFSQRFIIKSMQLVGATHWFIQKPFMKRGLWFGFLASLLSLMIIFILLYIFRGELQDVIVILQEKQRLLVLMSGVMIIGLFLSGVATLYAVNRFIRTESSKLY
ncbi:MAG: cell division protein FtsX [Flavobacteriales bacterium]|jgi:cell division transport system permease protein